MCVCVCFSLRRDEDVEEPLNQSLPPGGGSCVCVCVCVWTVVDMENGQFNTHIHHSYPDEEGTCARTLN